MIQLENIFEAIYRLSEEDCSSCGGVTASSFSGFVPEKIKGKEEKKEEENSEV